MFVIRINTNLLRINVLLILLSLLFRLLIFEHPIFYSCRDMFLQQDLLVWVPKISCTYGVLKMFYCHLISTVAASVRRDESLCSFNEAVAHGHLRLASALVESFRSLAVCGPA